MDYYEIWFNLKDTSKDLEFSEHMDKFMGYLRERDLIGGYRLARRKFGFGPPELGEFHVTIETNDLSQLDQAFQRMATRDKDAEKFHAPVYAAITDYRAGLYRDFPDPVRVKT